MYLHLPPLSPFHSPSKKSPSAPNPKALALLFHTFEDSILRHLNSLLVPEAGVSFSYLSRAAATISSVHAAAGALLSDPSLPGSDEAALCSYLNSSIKLLDVCNALLAEVERLHLGRLHLLFVVRLLSIGEAPLPEKIRKARESIREWQRSSSSHGRIADATGLVRDLQPRGPPSSEKATAVGRAIYVVDAISALVARALVAFLGVELDVAAVARAPGEFAWGEAFNELRAALCGEASARSPGEMEAVEASVRKLADIMDGPVEGVEATERLHCAVKELESATEMLTAGLYGLRGAVSDLFRAVLCTRNTALEGFCPLVKKCK